MRAQGIISFILLSTLILAGPALGQARITDGQQVLYGFDEEGGVTVGDISGTGSPLNLTIADPGAVTWLPGGGLTLNSPTLISSGGPATKLFNSLTSSQALTVEAWVTPANTTQGGPARIVSMSADPYLRNFTLGQGSHNVGTDLYSMRLRTTTTSLNGQPDIYTPLGSLATTLTHVVYTRDAGGNTTLFLDGVPATTGTNAGDFSTWNATYALGLGNELSADRPWLGTLHLVAVFDRSLSQVEVQQNFIAGPFLTPQPPSIITQPVNQTVYAGQSATFSVIAAGTGPLTYQWQRDLADIPGATDATYATGPTDLADDGTRFRCVVTNAEGDAISEEALLTVQDYSGVVRIMPLGDSITYDNFSGDTRPSSERISYRYPLWQLLTNAGTSFEFVGGVVAGEDIIPDPQDAHNEGWPGWTDAQIAANVYGWLVANPADIVLLHIGTNGLNSSPDDVEDILNEIDRWETDNGMPVHVVLAKIINRISYSSVTTQFNTNIEIMANARTGDLITIVDMDNGAGIIYDYPASGGDMVDNLHPNDDGYAKMAYVWYEALQTLLPDASLNCAENIDHYWMMEKEFPPYVNQFGAIAQSTNPPDWTSGQVGYAQLFDFTNEVNVADDNSLDWGPDDSFTMEFWMKKTNPVHGTATNNNEVILGRDDAGTQQHWWLGVAATTSPPGQVCLQLRDNNFNGEAIYSSTVVQDGQWHHVAAVRDGAAGTTSLYVDGLEEASVSIAYPAGFAGIDIPLNIGWLNLNPGYFYDGILDEVAFYSRALDDTEIAGHYIAGTGGLGYCTGGESAPIITSAPVTQVYADQIYVYDVQAVGNPAPAFALTGGPAGMTIDPATGLIQWTPTGLGNFPVEVEASNSLGSDTQMFTLTVAERPLCPEGMDAYWKLDDPTPGTYVDHFGGFDGVAPVSAPAPSSPGIVGDCQDFNGTSDFITVSDDPVFDWAADDDFTIELWFNATNVASRNKVMIGRDQGGGNPHWWLGLNQNTGYANWNLLDASKNGTAVTGSTSLNDGQWHHLVAVRDESLNQNRLYVDGGLVDTSTYNYTAGFGATTDVGIGYMAYNYNPDYYYDGKLDEIAIYTRALTEGEISDHWNGGAGKTYCSDDAIAPVIVSAPVVSGTAGDPYFYDVDATGNPAPTFGLGVFPAGMTMDPVTGIIDWLPATAGDYDVEVTATNAAGVDVQAFTISVGGPEACPADLNAYWKLDEDPGPPFVDWAGSADATCVTCPDPVPGLIGGAQWFDGTDEVNAPGSGNFDWAADASFTIAYWMKTDQSTAGNRVLVGRDGDGLHMWIGCDDNGTVRFQLKENGGDFVYLGGIGPVLNDNQWHYIVAVRDNDTDRNAVYVDNQLVDEATYDYTYGFASSAQLNVGYLNLGGHYRYHGALDDISVFDRALDDLDIKQRYENGLANLDLCTAAAPAFISSPVTDGAQGTPFTYDADAVGNPAPGYSLTTAPAGMTIDPVTGVIDWVPVDAGPADVVVAAANSSGVTEQPFTVLVAENSLFPDCMVSWWRLDETAGPPFIDLPAGYNASAANSPVPFPGKLGGAQMFDGVTHEVDVADVDQYDWTGDASFTVELWMMTASGGANHVIVGRDGGGASDVHWWVGALSDNTAYFGLRDSANQNVACASTTTVTDGAWHHIVAVRDGDLGTNRIWVDGVNENTVAATYAGDFVCEADLNIGYLNLSGHFRYPGAVDEIAVYCRALDEAEILAHYNSGVGLEYSEPIVPVITSTPLLMAYEGQTYAYDVESTGVPTASYGLTDPPSGMTIDPVTGVIAWTAGATGAHDVTVTAANTAGETTQAFTINVSPEPMCPADITSYWKLDETGGTNYADSFDGLVGAASPEPPAPAAGGIVGGAQYFNGSANYINVADDPTLDWAADQSFTIELWMNSTESTGNTQVMIGRDQGGGYPHWWLGVDNGGVPGWNMLDTNKNGVATGGSESIRDGQWHHMVAVRDESLNENRLYVDGALVGEVTHDYTAGFEATTSLGIGYMAYNGNPNYYYAGMLDEIALYDRALAVEEIQHNHDLGRMGYGYCDVFAPVFVSAPVTVAAVGTPYSYLAEAFANPLPVTYGLADGPAGLTVDPVSGLVAWMPVAAGEFPVDLTASSTGGVTHQEFTIITSFGDAPLITAITDVGQDQGGQVRLAWHRSVHDAADTGMDITGYGVYRRQDANKAAGVDKLAGWDYIDTVPARGDGVYQYVAPTLCDSTDTGGVCWSVFFISAMTSDPLVYFDSAPDSGYSIDNLAPPAPGSVQVAYDSRGNRLTWEPAPAADLRSYLVYRGQTAEFETGTGNLVATVAGTEWFDPAGEPEINPFEVFYLIAAQDSAGNIGLPAQPGSISGVDDPALPTRFALHNNVPNPFNPMTTIKYELPTAARVSLRIFDISGRLVTVLKNNEMESAGRHEVVWRGRDQAGHQVAAGVYFYRMEGPKFNQTRRMVLVK